MDVEPDIEEEDSDEDVILIDETIVNNNTYDHTSGFSPNLMQYNS